MDKFLTHQHTPPDTSCDSPISPQIMQSHQRTSKKNPERQSKSS